MVKQEKQQETQVIVLNPYKDIDFNNIPNANDQIDLEQFVPPVLSGKEHIGELFALLDYQILSGEDSDYGKDYMLLTVYDYKTDDIVMMSTGSQFVMPAVQALVDNSLTPCKFRFEKLGRSYKMVNNPEDNIPF